MPDGGYSRDHYSRRVPALPQEGESGSIRLTAWVEIEQQVLGGLIMACHIGAPERIDTVKGRGGVDLFHDPAHAYLAQVIFDQHGQGLFVSPVSLSNIADLDAALQELGGKGYVVKIAGAVISQASFPAYLDALCANRQKRLLAQAMEAARTALEAGKAVGEVAVQLEATAASAAMEAPGTAKPRSARAVLNSFMGTMAQVINSGEVPGVAPGIKAVDLFLPSLGPGEVHVLGGRPGMGKTALAIVMALRAAKRGHPVIFTSLEMMDEAIMARAVAAETAGRPGEPAVPYGRMRLAHELSMEQRRAIVDAGERLADLPLFFLDKRFNDPASIHAGCRGLLKTYQGDKMPLVVIDYLQLLRVKGASRFDAVSEASMAVKRMAVELQCPVLALSQLSRGVEQREDKRPVMSDLRESGQLEQDAESVLFAYREEYYHDRIEPDPVRDQPDWLAWKKIKDRCHNRAEVIVAKNRSGKLGTAKFFMAPGLNHVWEEEVLL